MDGGAAGQLTKRVGGATWLADLGIYIQAGAVEEVDADQFQGLAGSKAISGIPTGCLSACGWKLAKEAGRSHHC